MKKIVCCAIMLYAYHPPLCARMSASWQDMKQAWEERKALKEKTKNTQKEQLLHTLPAAHQIPAIIERPIESSFEDNPEFRRQVKLLLVKFTRETTVDLQPLEDIIITQDRQREWDALPWYSKFKHDHPIATECARFAVYSAAGALAYHYLNTTLNIVGNYIDPNERGPEFGTSASSSTSESSSASSSSSGSSSAAASPAVSSNSDGFINLGEN